MKIGESLIFCLVALAGTDFILPSNSTEYSEKRSDSFVLSEDTPTSIGHGIVDNLSESTDLVDVLVERELHFRVPRNYISDIDANAHTRSVTLVLVTLFPLFAGVSADGDHGKTLTENHKPLWWNNYPNLIRMVTTTMPFSVEHDPNTVVFNAEEHEPDVPWKYGLLKSEKRSWALADVYFKRPQEDDPGYMVSCSRNGVGPCDVSLQLSNDVILQYQFHQSLLPQWREIHQKVSALVESFIISGSK